MGIPKFFRWLTRRYPLILQNVKKEEDCPPTDNLYLDLNGIVHNCIHGNDSKRHERVSRLEDLEEVWINIMKAIDELVHTMKPQKLLFLAVDGVAPRAKMNQQRARRFRSAKDAMALRDSLKSAGKDAPELFDSNAISPGTQFMQDLNAQLAFFVQYKLNTDPLYQKLEVILSDGTVPGEGEHKMMDFIRQLKLQKDYDPNTRHCFYGADADLIMLSLITHEPHFMIIREEHIVKKVKQGGVQRIDLQRTTNYQLLHISLLREYFNLEYQELQGKLKMPFNVERIIDDFAFFCFFIGNDFIPSLTTLDIGEGALDSLIEFYKKCLPGMNDYITESGKIYWDRAEPFIQLLGKHEHDTFINRIDTIKNSRREQIVSYDQEFGNQVSQMDRGNLIKLKMREKIHQKKLLKIINLNKKPHGAKRYKKFLLIKKFAEDDEEEEKKEEQKSLSLQKQASNKKKQDCYEKYLKVKDTVYAQSDSEAAKVKEISQAADTLVTLLNSIHEQYFSDLQADEIPDSDVSDVGEDDLNVDSIAEGGEQNLELDTKMLVATQLQEKYTEENYEFMTIFVKLYSESPDKAKATYYDQKLKFDITTADGQQLRRKMLKKYLEGLQWVLYYYYKGVQHWRWYYPYHYAPMISDLGENIVQNYLGGKQCIDEFEIDFNSSNVNYPYTTFQQLLAILPSRSAKLLPTIYSELINGELQKSFPADFEIDLNGKTLPWEAICLIPFVDEKEFLEAEERLLKIHQFSEEDQKRNQIHFTYYNYRYYPQKGQPEPLISPLTNFFGLPQNFVSTKIQQDYQNVGKYSFEPVMHKGAILPNIDYPSFKRLGVKSFIYDIKLMNKVEFQCVAVNIPKCSEEESLEDLESSIRKFTQAGAELYIDFPYQIEACPVEIQSKEAIYQIYYDTYTGRIQVHKEEQKATEEQFQSRKKSYYYRFLNQGFNVEDIEVIATFNKVDGVGFDTHQKYYYKNYSRDTFSIPLSLVQRRRDPNHYLNVNQRINSRTGGIKLHKQLVCLNMHLFGLIGTADLIDQKTGQVRVKFNKEKEEQKIHDPFVGHSVLMNKNSNYVKKENIKRYMTDQAIEQKLKLKYGIVNKITGSMLITYTDQESMEKQVIDLGLNLKNFTKKVHIPDYVRYVQSEEVADNQHDSYTHNTHARGAKHVRKYFEYSEECVEIIQQYYFNFPEVFEFLEKQFKTQYQNKNRNHKGHNPLNTVKDIWPKEDTKAAISKVKQITTWIESLPVSHLPYVEMGFNALATDLIQKLDNHQSIIQEHYQGIKLNCKHLEYLNVEQVFQESFPFWSSPFSTKTPIDFNVGDRVMNINSSKREYVPFGLRGTVVGKTNDKIIVIYDQQYLGGDNIHGHCKNYQGSFIEANHLLNLTKKFASIMKKNPEVIKAFTEQPPEKEVLEKVLNVQQQQNIQDIEESKGNVEQQFNSSQDVNQMLEQLIQASQESNQYEQVQDQKQEEESKGLFQQKRHYQQRKEYQEKKQQQQQYAQQRSKYQPKAKKQENQTKEEEVKVEQQPVVQQEVIQQPNINDFVANNPDFQQLMDLMNIANQIKGPITFASQQSSDTQQQEGEESKKQEAALNLNSDVFVPSWQKKQE